MAWKTLYEIFATRRINKIPGPMTEFSCDSDTG